MSSFFSSSNRSNHRRSRSETRPGSSASTVRDKTRQPIINFDLSNDVATLVCIELSRALLTRPDMHTGVYLRTVENSKKKISMSDTSVIITSAILEHVGNKKSATKLLGDCDTLKKFYNDLGLNNPVVREMFVTMIFALSPEFVKLVDKTMSMVIDRSSSSVMAPHAEQRISNVLVDLENNGLITQGEMIKVSTMDDREVMDTSTRRPRNYIPYIPRTMIMPNDSASQIGSASITSPRPVLDERDLHDFIKRRKQKVVRPFHEEFNGAKPPIAHQARPRRSGLGFNEGTDNNNQIRAAMNNVLGSRTLASYNLSSGDRTYRRPRVDDYVESESVSNTAMRAPPSVRTVVTNNYRDVRPSKYVPTESLPLPFDERSSPYANHDGEAVDSLEMLNRKLNSMSVDS